MLFNAMESQAKNVKGNGEVITKEIVPGEFHSLSVGFSGVFDFSSFFSLFKSHENSMLACHYAQTETCSLKLTIDENLVDYIQIHLQDSVLTVQVKKEYDIQPTRFQLHVTSKELKQLTVSSAMDFYLDSPLQADRLKLTANGGSDIFMKQPVHADHLSCFANGGSDIHIEQLTSSSMKGEANGGSDIYLSGTADEAELEANGGADIKAYGFKVKRATSSANGGSDIYIYALETLRARANGGSDVHYKGPAQVDASANGGSDVTKED